VVPGGRQRLLPKRRESDGGTPRQRTRRGVQGDDPRKKKKRGITGGPLPGKLIRERYKKIETLPSKEERRNNWYTPQLISRCYKLEGGEAD